MADASPGGAVLSERTGIELVQVTAWPATVDEAVRILSELLSLSPPRRPNAVATSGNTSILAVGPGRWLIVRPAHSRGEAPSGEPPLGAKLAAALPRDTAAVLELSAGRRIFIVSGPRSKDLLAKYLPLDLFGSELLGGHCAQSAMAHIGVLLHVRSEEVFEIHVSRSFSRHLWEILADAAIEFAPQSFAAPAAIHDSI